MSREPWYDDQNPDRVARSLAWRLAVAFLLSLLFFALVGGIIWGAKVLTSDMSGRGEVIRKTNDADNRIFAQQKFEDRYQDIIATDKNLDVLAQAAKDDPANAEAKTRLTGAQAYCNTVVGKYNADARKITQAKFRAEDLPYEIDGSDVRTDCKPSGVR